MIKYYKNTEDDRIHEVVGDEEYQADCLVFNPTYIDATSGEIIAFQEEELSNVKSSKCSEINMRTEEIILAGFDHVSVHFDMKMEDQMNMNSLFNLLNMGVSMSGEYFRASGEDYHFTSDEDFLNVYNTGVTLKKNTIESGAALKNQINACTSIEEVNAIVDNR